jgi:hypothetical protein
VAAAEVSTGAGKEYSLAKPRRRQKEQENLLSRRILPRKAAKTPRKAKRKRRIKEQEIF